MPDHMWVMLTLTPIEVEVTEDGALHTWTTEMGDELAREDGKLGCWHCMTVLTTESFGTECSYEG